MTLWTSWKLMKTTRNLYVWKSATEKIMDVQGEDETQTVVSNFTNTSSVAFAQEKCYVLYDDGKVSSIASPSTT